MVESSGVSFRTATKGELWGVIVAGGKGTRIFPISQVNRQKQFCQMDEHNTFIQAAIENIVSVGVKRTRIVVITTSEVQTKLAKEQTLSRGVLSQNIFQIDPNYGYAGAMIKAAEFITEYDEDAIVINSPADQYLEADESYKETMHSAVDFATQGEFVVVGVKINDLVTAMGCGHAIYEETGEACFPVVSFAEKPERELADRLMRQGNSACNTGINVWRASAVIDATKDMTIMGLGTDVLMDRLREHGLRVAVGQFSWRDCGTLKSLYEISKKTPNHKNASLGKGSFERTNCRGSLLYASEGMELMVSGANDDAIVFTTINERPILVVAKLAESQRIKDLAEDYSAHENILTADFSFGARNNIVLSSNISDELIVGFVGVSNYAVYVHKRRDGTIEAAVSQQLTPLHE